MKIEDFIIKDSGLNPTEKILLGAVFNLSKRSKGCTAQTAWFVKNLGMTAPTIKRTISNLCKKGLIKRNVEKNNRIVYCLFQDEISYNTIKGYQNDTPKCTKGYQNDTGGYQNDTPRGIKMIRQGVQNDTPHRKESEKITFLKESEKRAPDQKNKNFKKANAGKPAKQDANLSAIAIKKNTTPPVPPAPPKFDFETAILTAWCSFYEENLKVRCNPPTGKRRISLFEVASCVSDTLGLTNGSRTSESAVTGFKRFLDKLPKHRRTAKELNPAFILNDYSQILAEMKSPKGRNVLPINERVSRSSTSLMSKVKMY